MAVFSTGECEKSVYTNSNQTIDIIAERSTTIGMKILSSTGRKQEDIIHKYHHIIQRMYGGNSTN